MKKFFFLILLSFKFILLISQTNYIIYDSKGIAGYIVLSMTKDSSFERVLMCDGFSREYTVAKHMFGKNYSYQSVSYYADDQMPVRISFENGILTRISAGLKTTFNTHKKDCIIYSGSAPAAGIIFSDMFNGRYKLINAYSGNELSNGVKDAKVFKKGLYPDSVYTGNYVIRKTDKHIDIENPYYIDYGSFYTKDDFYRKKIRIELSFGSFARGELSMDQPSDTVIVILPFSMNYNMYGNMSSQISPYTALQLAERIDKPVCITEFTFEGRKDYESLEKSILNINTYFSKRYSEVIYIAFNEFALVLSDLLPYSSMLSINPMLVPAEQFSKTIFERTNRRVQIFSNQNKFTEANPIFMKFRDAYPVAVYASHKGKKAYIISYSVLNESEKRGVAGLSGRVGKIKNIDRRLNNNILYDLWSFKKNIQIEDKVIKYINSVLNKL